MMGIETKPEAVFSVGDVVVSVAGRDKGKVFVVTAALKEPFVLIADGESRKVSYPKLKNQAHLRRLGKLDEGFDNEEKVSEALKKYESAEFSVLKKRYYKPKKG